MRLLPVVAFIVTVGVTVALLVMPGYRGTFSSSDAEHGATVERATSATLIEVNGVAHTLAVLSVPLVLCEIPLIWRRRTLPAALCLLLYAFISGASMGIWCIVPALLLMFDWAMSRAERVGV